MQLSLALFCYIYHLFGITRRQIRAQKPGGVAGLSLLATSLVAQTIAIALIDYQSATADSFQSSILIRNSHSPFSIETLASDSPFEFRNSPFELCRSKFEIRLRTFEIQIANGKFRMATRISTSLLALDIRSTRALDR